jgi:drug/metabolite transporter (DMT)-like permease
VLSIFVLGQKTRARSIIGILLGFTGVVIVSTRGFSLAGGNVDPLGILLAVGSALIWAVFWTLNLRFEGAVESKLFFNFLGGSLVASIVLLARGAPIPDISGWAASIYVGIFEMGVTFLIWMKALSLSSETARISMLIYLSPFVSLIFIASILGEPILISTIAGLVLIVVGLMVQGRPERKKA